MLVYESSKPEFAFLRIRPSLYEIIRLCCRATARVAPTRFETQNVFQTTICLFVNNGLYERKSSDVLAFLRELW